MKLCKLAGKLAEKGISQKKLAKFLGCDFVTVNRKIKGERIFNVVDTVRICDYLCIPYTEIPEYFIQKGEVNGGKKNVF